MSVGHKAQESKVRLMFPPVACDVTITGGGDCQAGDDAGVQTIDSMSSFCFLKAVIW